MVQLAARLMKEKRYADMVRAAKDAEYGQPGKSWGIREELLKLQKGPGCYERNRDHRG